MPDEQFLHELSNVRETAIRILAETSYVVVVAPLLLHLHDFGDRACAALACFPLFCGRRLMPPGNRRSQSHHPDILERLAFCALPLNGFLCTALVGCKFHWKSLSWTVSMDRAPLFMASMAPGGPAAYTTIGKPGLDRQVVVSGKSVSVRVDLGGRRFI